MEQARILSASDLRSTIVMGVDDAPENLMLLEMVLKRAGYTFIGAASGPTCLSLVDRAVPRLILLDVEMPVIDGFETCRRLRAKPALRSTPIAFLTNRNSAADVKAGMAAGGNDFLLKPFDLAKLVERVKHWTGRPLPEGVERGSP
jgi:two-component system, OmpR family, response regulator